MDFIETGRETVDEAICVVQRRVTRNRGAQRIVRHQVSDAQSFGNDWTEASDEQSIAGKSGCRQDIAVDILIGRIMEDIRLVPNFTGQST